MPLLIKIITMLLILTMIYLRRYLYVGTIILSAGLWIIRDDITSQYAMTLMIVGALFIIAHTISESYSENILTKRAAMEVAMWNSLDNAKNTNKEVIKNVRRSKNEVK